MNEGRCCEYVLAVIKWQSSLVVMSLEELLYVNYWDGWLFSGIPAVNRSSHMALFGCMLA